MTAGTIQLLGHGVIVFPFFCRGGLYPIAGDLAGGQVQPVECVCQRDGEREAGQFAFVEMSGGFVPQLIRHRIRLVRDAGDRIDDP